MIMLFLIFLFWYLCIMLASGIITIIQRLQYPFKYKIDNCYCDFCGKSINPKRYANLPILNYFLLKGKTKCCKMDINILYPISEFGLGGFIFLLLIFLWGF